MWLYTEQSRVIETKGEDEIGSSTTSLCTSCQPRAFHPSMRPEAPGAGALAPGSGLLASSGFPSTAGSRHFSPHTHQRKDSKPSSSSSAGGGGRRWDGSCAGSFDILNACDVGWS